MTGPTTSPDWCPKGFVEFLELSLISHRRNLLLMREGVEKGVFPAAMLEDQEKLARHNEGLLKAVRNDDPDAFRRISDEGIALSAALSSQAQALQRERDETQDTEPRA